MSTAGQAIGGLGGAVIGFFAGGPTGAMYGAQIGSMVGGIIDPVKTTTTGPRLSDLKVQTSTYGAVIPRVYGTTPVVGNVFWLEGNALKEVTKKTKSSGKGGPSVTSETYSYYATFAVGLCKGPIAGVRRIWVGANLIYDAGSSDVNTIIASNSASALFTLHLGTNTQAADDRMQAALGVANTPAYRGLAYIVLKDFPLEEYGNSLMGAQVKVEVVQTGSTQYFNLEIGTSSLTNRSGMAWTGNNFCAIGSVATANLSEDGLAWTSYTMPGTGWYAVCYGKNLLVAITVSNQNIGISRDGGRTWVVYTAVLPAGDTYFKIIWNGSIFCVVGRIYSATSVDGISWVKGILPARYDWRSIAWNGSVFCIITNQAGYSAVSSDGINWVSNPLPLSSQWIAIAFNGSVFCAISRSGYSATSVDGETWANHSVPVGAFADMAAGNGYFFTTASPNIYYSKDGINWTVRQVLKASSSYGAIVWNGAYFCGYDSGVSNQPIKVIPEIFSATLPPLSSIVQAECLTSNIISAGDVNLTALTPTVKGYKVSNVATLKSSLEPLQAVWPFDMVQKGYTIYAKVRGSSSIATVSAAELAASAIGGNMPVSITNVREMDTILPRRVVVSHLDYDREYDTGQQVAQRLNTDSVNIRNVELAIVMTANEAAAAAEMLLYLYWMERYDISFALPPTYNHLEPGDVITINATEGTYEVRLTSITYTQDGRVECTGKYNSATVYQPTAIGETGKAVAQTLSLPGSTNSVFLDLPALLDSSDTAGFPLAVGGYLSGWPGAVLCRTDDAGQTWAELQGFVPPGSTIGTTSTALPTGRSELMDKASTLTVSLASGSLFSVTEDLLFMGENFFAIGAPGRWEIVGAQTCTLQGDGSYVLRDLLRGQQGTEWAMSTHQIGDTIVLLDVDTLPFISTTTNMIGASKTYRVVTAKTTVESASDVTFAYTAVNLKPLAPISLNGSRHPTTNDWTLTWIRRTRIGGAWRDYVDASIGESVESYDVEIYSSNTYVTVKRTFTALSTPTVAYTSAMQVTDFTANQGTLYVKIYQNSSVTGRGYPLTATITR